MRWAARTDANQEEIVEGLRAVGASVESLHRVGRRVPDLLVGFRGVTDLLEVKVEGEEATDEQADWHAAWRGKPPKVVHNLREALVAIDAMRRAG